MLVGANAPLVLDRGVRSSHMQHVYDFYKPDMSSEYPIVDGKLSTQCYLHALDVCLQRYTSKAMRLGLMEGTSTLEMFDGLLFHSPYCKLVQKAFARILLADFLRDPSPDLEGRYSGLEEFRDINLESTYFDRPLEIAAMAASKELFEEKTKPSLLISNQVGNMYTPSLYEGLASFIASHSLDTLADTRVLLFSYGSGLASSMFSMKFTDDQTPGGALDRMLVSLADLRQRLDGRHKVSPSEFDDNQKLREQTHQLAPYTPVGCLDKLCPGTWYLAEIDSQRRRKYRRIDTDVCVS